MSLYTNLIDTAMWNTQQAKELFLQTFTENAIDQIPEDWVLDKFDCALDCLEITRNLDKYRNRRDDNNDNF